MNFTMKDETWVAVRGTLMVGGGFLAGAGYAKMEDITKIVDAIPTIVSGVTALASLCWALWVRINTRAVPIETAQRVDVPTVSPISGAKETGATVT
jgi:hypothetical protein